MTLDEALEHCEEVAEELDMKAGFETDNERYAMSESERKQCKECANDHRQLANWLKELKHLREREPCEDVIGRSETIEYLNTNMGWYNEDGEMTDNDEKLKAITDLINGVPSVIPVPKKCHNENHDYSEYEYETSVDNFLINEVNAETEEE